MKQKIVVLGGGTGTAVVLQGLKEIEQIHPSAVISVSDSGGSTGRLRDEFGFSPVGDLRQALAALAKNHGQSWIREILLYRFAKGAGLEGHNLGNLILTALQDLTGSTAKALEIASAVFNLKGDIYPVTTSKVDLVIEYTDGTFVLGEHHLNPLQSGGKQIKKIRLSPKATLYSKAKAALLSANAVVIGPGDLYGSLLSTLTVAGIKPVFKQLHVPIIYLVNLMTSYTQTDHYSATMHVLAIERAIGRPVTHILINNRPIPRDIVKAYKKQHDEPVKDDFGTDPRVIRAPLIKTTLVTPEKGDTLIRSYLRHDFQKVAGIIQSCL